METTSDPQTQREREDAADFDRDEPGAHSNGGDPAASGDERETLDDLEGDGDHVDEEDDGQLFVWDKGTKVTLGTIIKRGTPVEYEISMGSKSVKGQGSLIGHDETDVMLLARCVVGSTTISPIRDSDDNITKVKIRQHLKPKAVLNAHSEAGAVALRGE